ncbi:MAG: hypothetical protein SAJ37_00660 [Oscillatoria sp. PMC 1068.18]|nr:hypothetical protein [Oscillatoria sp. PMC 1076.18]MEC4987232.1 hypothetical protein [Oscillatoria sp. PMC 1068.18]
MADISKDEMRDRLGNIEQIRDLLFGDKNRQFEQRFQQVEIELSELKQEMREQFQQIKDSFSTDLSAAVDSWEKKLKYLSLTSHEEMTKIRQQSDEEREKVIYRMETIHSSLNNRTNALSTELEQSREKLNQEVNNLQNLVLEELQKRFSNLKETKISRDDLAEVLFELCIKVKGSDFVPDLKEAADSKMKAEFLLPDDSQNEESKRELNKNTVIQE